MQDDLISAMTHEVKEGVINNYLYERRLIEEQITYVKELADHAAQLQEMLFKRLHECITYFQCLNSSISLCFCLD